MRMVLHRDLKSPLQSRVCLETTGYRSQIQESISIIRSVLPLVMNIDVSNWEEAEPSSLQNLDLQ